MALQTSGAISLLDIQNEFGGSNPIGINEYYGAASGIPSSGTIDFADFYGASNVVVISSNQKQILASSFVSAGGTLQINSGVYIWSDSTSVAALIIDVACTVINYGRIMGRGGNGSYTGTCLLYTSPSPRDGLLSRMPSSA